MTLLIKKPGILTTVQDLGRTGFLRFGVNPNGVMDPLAARIANILVGNDDNAALLEMHFPAAEIEFQEKTVFSLAGADLGAEVDGQPLTPWRANATKAGAILRFTQKRRGERVYLAIRGGFDIPLWLDSASTNLAARIGGLRGQAIKSGDRIYARRTRQFLNYDKLPACAASLLPQYSRFPTVRIIAGAEFGYLSTKSSELLIGEDFVISGRSNRMGFRLSGEALELADSREFVSAAVCFGTVQLLPDGQLIILMADQQTAGGYPRIAHVISCDLSLVGQLGAGDKIAFHLVDQAEAERLILRLERELSFLRVACKFAYR